MSIIQEFKTFAMRGNAIDLAVGVVVGAAFTTIVNSLVHNIIMPLVGVVMPGKHGYENWVLVVRGKPVPYGRFLGDTVNFLIVALALYVFIVKFVGWIMAFRKEQAHEAPPPTKDQELLTEIRDLIKDGSRPN